MSTRCGWLAERAAFDARRCVGAVPVVRRRRADPLEVHVGRREQAEHRLVARLAAASPSAVGDHLVARSPAPARGRSCPRTGRPCTIWSQDARAAAEQHVGPVWRHLLGDRAGAAVLLGVGRAVGHVCRALAAAVDDVRGQHGRRRVGQLGGGHVAGAVAGLLGQLEDRRHRLARRAAPRSRRRTTCGRSPSRCRSRPSPARSRAGSGRPCHRVRRVGAGHRQRVHRQPAGRTDRVVAGDGDLAVAHAVADQQDDVAGRRRRSPAVRPRPWCVDVGLGTPSGPACGAALATSGTATSAPTATAIGAILPRLKRGCMAVPSAAAQRPALGPRHRREDSTMYPDRVRDTGARHRCTRGLSLAPALRKGGQMHPNEELITRFYTAFNAKDADTMAASYADEAVFTDPGFGRLTSHEARAMWRMLLGRATDLRAEFSDVHADDEHGSAHWEAYYTFNGRPVHNVIDADFDFKRRPDHPARGQLRLAALGRPGPRTPRQAVRSHVVPAQRRAQEGARPARGLHRQARHRLTQTRTSGSAVARRRPCCPPRQRCAATASSSTSTGMRERQPDPVVEGVARPNRGPADSRSPCAEPLPARNDDDRPGAQLAPQHQSASGRPDLPVRQGTDAIAATRRRAARGARARRSARIASASSSRWQATSCSKTGSARWRAAPAFMHRAGQLDSVGAHPADPQPAPERLAHRPDRHAPRRSRRTRRAAAASPRRSTARPASRRRSRWSRRRRRLAASRTALLVVEQHAGRVLEVRHHVGESGPGCSSRPPACHPAPRRVVRASIATGTGDSPCRGMASSALGSVGASTSTRSPGCPTTSRARHSAVQGAVGDHDLLRPSVGSPRSAYRWAIRSRSSGRPAGK